MTVDRRVAALHGAARSTSGALWLTDLDAAIGDGDHGINLDRGFAALLADLERGRDPDRRRAARC